MHATWLVLYNIHRLLRLGAGRWVPPECSWALFGWFLKSYVSGVSLGRPRVFSEGRREVKGHVLVCTFLVWYSSCVCMRRVLHRSVKVRGVGQGPSGRPIQRSGQAAQIVSLPVSRYHTGALSRYPKFLANKWSYVVGISASWKSYVSVSPLPN